MSIPVAFIPAGLGAASGPGGGGGSGDMLAAIWDTDSNGAIDIAKGGTNATSAATARTNLGTAASGNNNDLTQLSGLLVDIAVADGGTGASTAAAARTNLGLAIGSNVQAWDADLDSLAGIGLTAAGLALLDDANAAAQRATLGSTTVGDAVFIATNAAAARTAIGAVIGTDVQAYDGELSAIAGLTSAANKLPYFTGSGTAAVADFTAAGRALVDDADAVAQRATLGLAAVAASGAASDLSGLATVATSGSASDLGTGTLPGARTPAFTGDATKPSGSTVTTVVAIGGVTVSAFIKTLVDDADAATARTTLGLAAIAASGSGADLTAGTVTEAKLSFSDITTANATSSQHGLMPKLSGLVTDVARGDGTYGPPETPSTVQLIDEDFGGGGFGVLNTRTSGTGAAVSIISNAAFAGHDGVANLSTGTTTTGFAALGNIASSNAQAALVLGDGSVVFEWDFYLPAVSNGTDTFTIRLGCIDANNAESTDCVEVRYSDGVNSGKLQYVTRSNNTETATDSAVTIAATTWYKARCVINAAGTSAVFTLNDANSATIATNIPTGITRYTGFGASVIKSAGTTAASLYVDYAYLRKVLTTAR